MAEDDDVYDLIGVLYDVGDVTVLLAAFDAQAWQCQPYQSGYFLQQANIQLLLQGKGDISLQGEVIDYHHSLQPLLRLLEDAQVAYQLEVLAVHGRPVARYSG